MAAAEVEVVTFTPDIWIRASSLSTLFDCPERWAAQHPQLGAMRMPSSAASAIGTAVHAGCEVYDMARLIRVRPSLGDALDAAVEKIDKPEYEVIWDDFNQRQAKSIATQLVQSYCTAFSSRFEFDAIEMDMDYLDVVAANGLKIRFTGKIDRRRVLRFKAVGDQPARTRRGICDIKTGKKVILGDGSVNVQVSGAQMAVYELLELMSTNTLGKSDMLPVMIFAFPTVGKNQPAVSEIKEPPHRLLTGDADHKGAIDIAADMIKSGNYYGNARSMLCTPRYCPKHGNCRWQFTGENVYDDPI